MKAVNDTVSRRITRVAAVIIVVVLAVGGAGTWALLRSSGEVDRLAEVYGPASDANAATLTYMLDIETAIRGYALSGQSASLRPYRDALGKVMPALDDTGDALHTIGDHTLDGALAVERRHAQSWIDTVARPAARGVMAARRATGTTAARARFDAFRRANTVVAAKLDSSRRSLRSDARTLSQWVVPAVLVIGVVVLLGAGFAALRTARSVSGPLRALSDVVRRLEDGDLSARADDSLGPVEVRTASAAVNSLATERARALDREEIDDGLRGEVRELTAAIRIGQDPQTMARTLVAGLGRVFDLDLVWLFTFEDGRVPLVASRWRRDGKDGPLPRGGADDLMLQGLANRLWHAGTVVGIPDHEKQPASGRRIAVPDQLPGARASAVVAIGEGNSALGLLWLSTLEPRSWSRVELGLFQHMAGELAQSLVQNHVLAQQRAAMRRLREADEAKTALVSTVSHELRTPLTSIIGYLDLLLDSYGGDLDQEVTDMLRVVERNATRLRSMIEDLLRQSEVETDRRADELDRIDVALVLQDVEETISPLANNAQLDLETRRPEQGAVVVDGTARELTQAVVNLAANAVKFTRPGGRVSIAAGRDGDNAEIRVSDSGIGIPADEIPHLFERFFRARNARSAVIPGTGLGLAIVADIVHRHHGSIEVQSTLGVGTSFLIRLPLAAS